MNQNQVKALEELEVIEATELAVGNAFHAFRFDLIHVQPTHADSTDKAE
jgi:hypothetical protein